MSAKVQELTQDLQQRVLAHQLALSLSLSLSLLYINIYNVIYIYITVNYQQNKTTRQPEGRPIVPEGVWKFSLRGCFEYVYNIAVYKLCIIPMTVGEMKDFLGSLAWARARKVRRARMRKVRRVRRVRRTQLLTYLHESPRAPEVSRYGSEDVQGWIRRKCDAGTKSAQCLSCAVFNCFLHLLCFKVLWPRPSSELGWPWGSLSIFLYTLHTSVCVCVCVHLSWFFPWCFQSVCVSF